MDNSGSANNRRNKEGKYTRWHESVTAGIC